MGVKSRSQVVRVVYPDCHLDHLGPRDSVPCQRLTRESTIPILRSEESGGLAGPRDFERRPPPAGYRDQGAFHVFGRVFACCRRALSTTLAWWRSAFKTTRTTRLPHCSSAASRPCVTIRHRTSSSGSRRREAWRRSPSRRCSRPGRSVEKLDRLALVDWVLDHLGGDDDDARAAGLRACDDDPALDRTVDENGQLPLPAPMTSTRPSNA